MRMASPIVQYIVLRKDLVETLKWPTGALIAQACHACTAVMHQFREETTTQHYLADIDRMHKVVLEAKDEDSLISLSEKLKTENVDHKLWMEQPENIPTCIATRPYQKDLIQIHFKKFKLMK
ncbi:putative peptidyl-tRNA hydrolase PTRHD1 [Pecten maximus]|uniref:putative peptidyl-tRNA hydrolase PTRHD1 n=1 Tax=Pecten maximus TaxID=6579 RepID=UPI0014589AC3|nr:putative peptidyl-tRNA hydrolase PTRHD1 [Pecten maximus]